MAATLVMSVLTDFEKNFSFFILGVDIMITSDTKAVIKQTRGHDGILSLIEYVFIKKGLS